jgi:hypothetical protein
MRRKVKLEIAVTLKEVEFCVSFENIKDLDIFHTK